jgi:hypothetical protein
VIVGRQERLCDGFCRDRPLRLESGYALPTPHAADRLGAGAAGVGGSNVFHDLRRAAADGRGAGNGITT